MSQIQAVVVDMTVVLGQHICTVMSGCVASGWMDGLSASN